MKAFNMGLNKALVYHILPPTTTVTATPSVSKNCQLMEFFVGAQMAASLVQTTQIISGVCFVTAHVAYASIIKTRIV